MQDADDATVAIVGAVACLLALVAHADSDFADSELSEIERQLARIEGFTAAGIETVCDLLRRHGSALSAEGIQACTRVLYEQSDREMRLEVLDVLMDVAAADGVITMEETNLLRRVCAALGLSDADYLASQTRYREPLSVLKT